MPALSASPLLSHLAARSPPAHGTNDGLQVVCAWPLSGQYGPGSRVLYYVLVAACVFARKAEWLRNACLAAALLLPAVAAIHAIVLASVHVQGAVDMDVYGAFQYCTIGILAAPLTVRLSRTYFYDPGRNTIFLWTGLILAGLASLAVEFYRVSPSHCAHDDDGAPISTSVASFPYQNASCGLVCTQAQGPHSPMRNGPLKEIYVIPVPSRLSFNAGMLVAAACCIPAILSLIFTLDKILEINWKTRFGGQDQRMNDLIEGTNGATVGKMKGVNEMVRFLLSVIEVPLFAAAVLAILIIGEINFFSAQVSYQTEPIASIGQWGPIAGTILAALGSLYLLLTGNTEEETTPPDYTSHYVHHCNCSHHDRAIPTIVSDDRRSSSDPCVNERISDVENHCGEMVPPARQQEEMLERTPTMAAAESRRRVAKLLTAAGNYLGTAAHDKLDLSSFNREARDFPEIPGERMRNKNIAETQRQYAEILNRSRAVSMAGSIHSATIEGSSSSVRNPSLNAESDRDRSTVRRDTLEVPSPKIPAAVWHRS
ncbi:hypothetical protein BS50DRAFT_579978 [Corynespora cassiicola Philippines]|uniref:Uncharacterized protein n=1 Tax=Corynespora cassiicola Philippines TaxID=1448308 RepID=A0A2T2N1R5_CORCC|nr:hypothetical protein BS50DRAFT_579978 [Corynespora cassiicola Philippines]